MPSSNVEIPARDRRPSGRPTPTTPDTRRERYRARRLIDLGHPLHVTITPDSVPGIQFRLAPTARGGRRRRRSVLADLLLAALSACQEVTLRMVAANMGIDLEERR